MDRPRVLVCDPIAEDGVELMRQTCEVDVIRGQSPDELLQRIGDYDALVVRSETRVNAEQLEAAKKLRVIGRAGVGVDNIDINAATRHGVLVVNAPTGNTIAAAEHTVAMMMALARRLPHANRSMLEGKWDRQQYIGFELRGKTLGIVGLGAVGSEVAKRAQGLEMNVIAHDPMVTPERAEQFNIDLVESLDELCARSDLITLHIPLVPATRHLVDARLLAKCKAGVRIINVARGGVIDEKALLAALESGHVAGAALDVFEEEPPGVSPLVAHPLVIATPHLGASTEEAQVGVASDVAQQIVAILQGRPPRWAVNAPAVLPEEMQALAPYMRLAEKLGSLYAQAGSGGLKKLELEYTGELARHDVTYLTAEVLRGLLGGFTEGRINVVNARLVAAARGIEVTELRTSAGAASKGASEYPDLITLRATGGESFVAAATVLPQGPRIVRLDSFVIDLVPEGRFILTYHDDRPGVIGKVGTILGDANINIAALHLGRDAPRGHAVMIVQVDDEVPDDAKQRLLAIEGMSNLRLVEL